MVTIEQSNTPQQGTRPAGFEVTAKLKQLRVRRVPNTLTPQIFVPEGL